MNDFLMPIMFFLAHTFNAISRSTDDLAEMSAAKGGAKKVKLFEFFSHTANIFSLLAVGVGVWFSINTTPPFFDYEWYWYLIIFILTRSFYDYTRNIFIGMPLGYRGSSLWDKLLIKLRMPENYLIMARIISLILAFTFAYRFKI